MSEYESNPDRALFSNPDRGSRLYAIWNCHGLNSDRARFGMADRVFLVLMRC
jgi:hypothetical protein